MKGAQSFSVWGHWWWGIARAVIVILDEGRVLDSIVQATLVPLQQTSLTLGRSITLFL